jgi:hypothetical protein
LSARSAPPIFTPLRVNPFALDQLTNSARHPAPVTRAMHHHRSHSIVVCKCSAGCTISHGMRHWIDLISKLNHPSSCSEGCYALSRAIPWGDDKTQDCITTLYAAHNIPPLETCACMRPLRIVHTRAQKLILSVW